MALLFRKKTSSNQALTACHSNEVKYALLYLFVCLLASLNTRFLAVGLCTGL